MIQAITVTNHKEETLVMELMRPEASGFIVLGVEGLGPGKANVALTEMSGVDGAMFNSARVGSRNIVFRLGFFDTLDPIVGVEDPNVPKPGRSIEQLRHLSYTYFPLKRKIKIQIQATNRTAETYGYVESNEPNIFSKTEGCIVSILCPKAYLYAPMQEEAEFGSIIPTFLFPFSSTVSPQLQFSEMSLVPEKTIMYTGDASIGIVINIHATGAASGVSISEYGTLNYISIDPVKFAEITGSGIVSGDDIAISTVIGDKYARLTRSGIVTNIINALGPNPYWFQLDTGDNVFVYSALSGLSNLQFTITHDIAYEGI